MPKLSERLDNVTLGTTPEGTYEIIEVPAALVSGVLTPPQVTDAQEGEFLQVVGGLIVGAVGVDAGDHAPSHEQGGGDELSLDASQIATGTLDPARVTSAAEGEYVRMVGGVLVGDSPAGPGSGDIESVTAGDGLDGGGTSGAVTLSVEWGTGSLQVRHGDDAAYTDTRVPTAHTHVFADLTGVAPSSHAHNASAITAGVLDPARISTAAEGEYLRLVSGVLVGATPSGGGGAGDIESVIAGQGLDGGGTSGDVTLDIEWGTGANQVRHGNDAAYSDARTPTSHVHAGSDITSGTVAPARITTASDGDFLRLVSGVIVGATPGGSGDITDVVSGVGLTGGATSGSATLAVDFGTSANQVRHGNDAAYTDSRTPTAHAHAGADITSGTVAPARITTAAEGEYVRLVGGVLVGATPSGGGGSWTEYQKRSADLSLTTSAVTYATLTIPAAGTYKLEVLARIRQQTATTLARILLDATGSNVVEIAGSWTRGKRNYVVDAGQSYVSTSMVSSQASNAGDVHEITWDGQLVVSAATTVTLRCTLGAGTGQMLRGSTVRVLYESATATSYGHANYISVTSGSGYEGSTYTSTNAAQWTADGANISGQTGTTYVLTRDLLGQAIKCGDSNTIQMWTPVHLPTIYKTDGTNFGGWWDPNYSATVTLNSGNVASISNLFSGGPAQAQGTSGSQPALTGGFIAPTGTKLLNPAANICLAYAASIMRYRAGTETTFNANARVIGAASGRQALLGNSGAQQPYILSPYAPIGNTNINTTPTVTLVPLPTSLVELTAYTPIVNAFGLPGSDAGTEAWNGLIGETVYLCANPNNSALAQLQGYLMWHNGIQTRLPPDHPHYLTPPRMS